MNNNRTNKNNVSVTEHSIENRALDRILKAVEKKQDDNGLLNPLDDLEKLRMADDIIQQYNSGKKQDKAKYALPPGHSSHIRILKLLSAAILLTGISLLLYFEIITNHQNKQKELKIEKSVANRSNILPSKRETDKNRHFSNTYKKVSFSVKTENKKKLISLSKGHIVSIRANTSLSVNKLANGKIIIVLHKGSILCSIDPEQNKKGFIVKTPKETILVTGTIFSVDVKDTDINIKLFKGTLKITDTNKEPKEISSPCNFTQFNQTVLNNETLNNIINELKNIQIKEPQNNIKKYLTIAKQLNINKKTEPQKHLLSDHSNNIKRVSFTDNHKFTNTDKTEHKDSISELMTKAHERKLQGNWKLAAHEYIKIVTAYPNSEAAQVSKVSLGQLFLNRLQQPSEAIKYFTMYLKTNPDGILYLEALTGKASALKKSGKNGDALKLLHEILKKYPEGLHVESIKKSIKKLE